MINRIGTQIGTESRISNRSNPRFITMHAPVLLNVESSRRFHSLHDKNYDLKSDEDRQEEQDQIQNLDFSAIAQFRFNPTEQRTMQGSAAGTTVPNGTWIAAIAIGTLHIQM
jgi:hypothetical protein